MAESVIECVERTTGGDVRLGIIWLHGLGADGHDFEPIVDELALDFGARFVFPHAPVRRVTINGGMPMRAWFDLFGLDRTARQDERGLADSAAVVRSLVDREVERGLPPDRIVLGGFSQGGAVALHAGLREPRRLGGLLALSAFLPLASSLGEERSAANADVPILMAHGDGDPVVPLEMAALGKDVLVAAGYDVDWRVYRMGHHVVPAEIRDVAEWLRRRAGIA